MQLVKDKKVRTEGVILVEHDADGEVTRHADRRPPGPQGHGLGRRRRRRSSACSRRRCWPRSSSARRPAALVGKFAKHKVESGIEDRLGDKLKPGTAAIIAIVDDDDRLAAEQALADSPAKSVVEMDEQRPAGAQGRRWPRPMGKFSPDRTVLPIPDRAFGGTAGRTLRRLGRRLVDDPRAEGAGGRAERAASS